MAYNPTVNDNSGQILAGYQMQAADLALAQKQQQAEQFAQIGSAITEFAAMQQGGKAFKKFMGVAGPSMGISQKELNMFKDMSDTDAYQMSSMMLPMGPSMISANSYANNFAPRAQFANQQAANQMALRQPAPNQVPMTAPTAAPAAATAPAQPAPGFGSGINTRPAF